MARIRSIKPEFYEHPGLQGSLSLEAHFTFPRLWQEADARGILREQPEILWAKCYALRYAKTQDERHSLAAVRGYLGELCTPDESGRPYVIRYEAFGRKYLVIPGFQEHQRIDVSDEWAKLAARVDDGSAHPEPPAELISPWWNPFLERGRSNAKGSGSRPKAAMSQAGPRATVSRPLAAGQPPASRLLAECQQGGQQGGAPPLGKRIRETETDGEERESGSTKSSPDEPASEKTTAPPFGDAGTPKTSESRLFDATSAKPKERKPPTGDHARTMDAWQMAFVRVTGSKPTFDGKTVGNLARLAKTHGAEELIRRMKNFELHHRAGSFGADSFALGAFTSHIDRWAVEPQARDSKGKPVKNLDDEYSDTLRMLKGSGGLALPGAEGDDHGKR